MRLLSSSSWQIHIERWAEAYDLPLWIRAAERIQAAGPLVPGPLEIEPPPRPSIGTDRLAGADPADADLAGADLTEGWLTWWHEVTGRSKRVFPDGRSSPPDLAGSRPDLSFSPPEFAGLTRWPVLREVAARRWPEANQWHSERKRVGIEAYLPSRSVENQVVDSVERSLRRPVRPFVLEVVVLPVRDDELRRVHEARYLVPERVYDGPGWPQLLRPLVFRLGG